MKKIIATLFLIFFLISSIDFVFHTQIVGYVANMISPSYSWSIVNGVHVITLLLTIVFVAILLVDHKKN